MTDNSRQIIERMQSSFPHTYNIYDKSTILYALISSFGERFGSSTSIIDRLYAMIGIDSTYDEDLEHRWGSLLGIYRQNNESYNDYRSRLLIVYSSLAGGTSEAIKYAIASAIGITISPDIIDKYIKVYDAWEYPYDTDDIDKSYGNIVCTVDLQANENMASMYDKIMDAINKTKASGINQYLLFVYTINEISSLSYTENIFNKLTYNSIEDSHISSYADDKFAESIIDTIQESDAFNPNNNTNMWANVGTNYAVLNGEFITNMLMEVDEFTDTIIYV